MESKNILSAPLNLDITFYKESIDYIELQLEDYELGKAIDSSKLKVMGTIQNTLFDIRASGSNCDNLWKIINEFFKPNLYTELELEIE